MKQIISNNKKVYVVLGMPRSGTSAVARSLMALGVNLGENLQSADSRNPRGFYEDMDVMYTINRGVTRLMDTKWMPLDTDPQSFEVNSSLRDFKKYAENLVCEKLVEHDTWGFKDPRTTTILPFWQAVFKTVNVEDRYIIVVRHPLAAARSLQKFAHVDLPNGLIVWLNFLCYALRATKNKKRVVISYEAMLQAPEEQLLRLHKQLGIEKSIDMHEVDNYANHFLDKDLRHHQNTDDELLAHPATTIVPVCVKLYNFAMSLASDDIVIDSDAFHDAWHTLNIELEKSQPTLDIIESLRAQNKNLERELRTVQKSLPWKLIYPLRVIDDLLRRRRNRNRRKLAANYAE